MARRGRGLRGELRFVRMDAGSGFRVEGPADRERVKGDSMSGIQLGDIIGRQYVGSKPPQLVDSAEHGMNQPPTALVKPRSAPPNMQPSQNKAAKLSRKFADYFP
jgi:hypothetical protein